MILSCRKFLFFILISTSTIQAQVIVKGKITDTESGIALAAANIQIENTFSGTISNEEGFFIIEINDFPAVLLCSYIGYKSARITIKNDQTINIEIKLIPIILPGEEIVVTAEDPAMQIMREVIKQKKIWRKELHTFIADAYTRLTLENDSGIVSVSETVSLAYWDVEKGTREVVKSRKQTENLPQQFLIGASGIPNFYDDEIEINGNRVIGVTHPDALDYYKFKLTGRRKLDDKTVFDIKVISNTKLQPVFEGSISVLDEVFALINIELIPGKSILFPPPIREWNMYYIQQFSNYGQAFWLPVDIHMTGDIKISFPGMEFPKILYKQTSHLTDYHVNVELPDSLYKNEREIIQDSVSVARDSTFALGANVIPLSVAEDSAYQRIDSTDTFDKAFAPKGLIADMVSVTVGSKKNNNKKKSNRSILKYFLPWIWYNRVDEFHLGFKIRSDIEKLHFSLGTAYNTGNYIWDYWADINYRFYKPIYIKIGVKYEDHTEINYATDNYSVYITSLLPLLTLDDYFDYHRNKGFTVYSHFSPGLWNLDFELGYRNITQRSIEKSSDFNILGKTHFQRPNPAIEDGRLQSVNFSVQYGDDIIPFGFVGQNRCKIQLEKSIGAPFSFMKYDFSLDWRIKTFLKRRFMPNVLDLRLVAGGSTWDLPLTRFGSLDGNLYAFSPYGVFRSLNGRPYIGEKYAAVYLEHNFRTVPFELLGLNYLVKRGVGVIIYGASGRTWISDERLKTMTFDFAYSDHFHNEIGFSINSIFSFLRTDFTWRLDRPAFYVGISFARVL